MTVQEQLDLWVAGTSVHNPDRGECCPDFSCCEVGLRADEDVRRRFAQAYQEQDHQTMENMCTMFLGALFSGHNAHVIGQGGSEQCDVH